MIRVSLSLLVFIYLTALLLTVFGAWLVHEWRRQRSERQAIRSLVHCSLCGFDFEDRAPTDLPHCPRCGSANERLPHAVL